MRKPLLALAAAALITVSMAGCSNDGALVEKMRSSASDVDIFTDEELASIVHSGCDRVDHADTYTGWAEQVYAENPAAMSADGARHVAELGMTTACPDKYKALSDLD